MRIAIVGSGISGLASAWLLSRQHEVHLFEADARLGGHTDTHDIELDGRGYRIDTGFIVHNPQHYPLLTAMFDELGVQSQPTTMSFSAHHEATGLEYNADTLGSLFSQRRNTVSPRFWRMLVDLVRFYRSAPALLEEPGNGPTLGDYLDAGNYGRLFREAHLVPMASALWSSPAARIESFPAKYLVRFMANHQMLQLSGRPQWRVVRGGSSTYIHALQSAWRVRERVGCPVLALRRDAEGVEVTYPGGVERFDQVVVACHSDQALSLLADADERETSILGSIPYQSNDTVLHTDAALLPRNPRAWAAWNAFVPADPAQACTVSYCMNVLQSVQTSSPLVVTLNRTDAIDPARILRRRTYSHPVYTHASVAAQARRHEIQGARHTWFAGAYWGWGFHEDGIRSAADVARALGAHWPVPVPVPAHATSAGAHLAAVPA
ncbi:NAD(P)/FAD-dependent oxidoreductase [Cognatilysobacter lacus]|uniref:FAD-dependent oxidoreductase n=1 Tax=Cognatilysobacter lacus TaxID=1643323 RepID=A0A5D8Z8F1_9GAMM|nr:FAD-dependent oxidoreductase [Lysobacter lacus]TZF90363.1 FAD-dependent oxidoreductase [Lysobacter lacus]